MTTTKQAARELVREALRDNDVSDSTCDRVIRALDVAVEPDDWPLPARLGLVNGSRYEVMLPGYGPTLPILNADTGLCIARLWIARHVYGMGAALIHAYNRRHQLLADIIEREKASATKSASAWRTGLPAGIADYAVIVEDVSAVPLLIERAAVIAHWDQRWFFPQTFKVATARVVGWQPLPD